MKVKQRQSVRVTIRLILLAAVIAIVCVLVQRIEPRYDGRSLTSWLNRAKAAYAQCKDPEHPETDPEWQTCRVAVKAMDKKALPFLMRWVDSAMKIKIIRWLNRHPRFHIETYPDPALQKHILAMHGFALLRSNAAPVFPRLVEMTKAKDRDTRFWAFVALASAQPGKEILSPTVSRLLKDSDSEIKNTAAQALFGLYPDEAKRVGACELFPEICNPRTNVVHHMH